MGATVTEASAATQKPAAQPTIGGSVYVKPQDIAWEPTQFEGISIKVLYEDKPKGEMTCLRKWEPGATLPMHNRGRWFYEAFLYPAMEVHRQLRSAGCA